MLFIVKPLLLCCGKVQKKDVKDICYSRLHLFLRVGFLVDGPPPKKNTKTRLNMSKLFLSLVHIDSSNFKPWKCVLVILPIGGQNFELEWYCLNGLHIGNSNLDISYCFAELPLLCDNTMPSSSSLSLPSSSCCLFVCLFGWLVGWLLGWFVLFVCLFVCLCESFVSFVSFVSLVSLVSLASFVSLVSLVSLASWTSFVSFVLFVSLVLFVSMVSLVSSVSLVSLVSSCRWCHWMTPTIRNYSDVDVTSRNNFPE